MLDIFCTEKINVRGQEIKPIDLTAALLFPEWKLKPGEEDFTIMRIIIDEERNGKIKQTSLPFVGSLRSQ